MFRAHVFRDAEAPLHRYIGAYVLNYFMGLAALWMCRQVIRSPYVAGIGAIVIVSTINYFVLKRLVFIRRLTGEAVEVRAPEP